MAAGKDKILIIDDEKAHQELLQEIIREEFPNLVIDTARTAKQARAKIETTYYAVVLIDFQLPDGNGIEILDFMNKHQIPGKPVFITGKGSEELAVQAMHEGVFDYIRKTSDVRKLRRRLISCMMRALEQRPNPEKLHLLLFHINSHGPNLIKPNRIDNKLFPEDILSKIGVYYFTAVGQGNLHNTGLFGPFPVPERPNYLALAYAGTYDTEEILDPRMGTKSYIIIVLIIPAAYDTFFRDRKMLELVFVQFKKEHPSIGTITDKSIAQLKERLTQFGSSSRF